MPEDVKGQPQEQGKWIIGGVEVEASPVDAPGFGFMAWGWAFVLLGSILLVISLFTNTSFANSDIVNIGLLQYQVLLSMFGLASFINGTLLISVGWIIRTIKSD